MSNTLYPLAGEMKRGMRGRLNRSASRADRAPGGACSREGNWCAKRLVVSLLGVGFSVTLWAGMALDRAVSSGQPRDGQEQRKGTEAAGRHELGAPVDPLELEGIENAFRLGPKLYSGGQPDPEAGFRALAERGVTTVISVDGARPDLEHARRYGLQYVHVPIGYDGLSRQEAWAIAQAVRTSEGPVFIHCHHGKHRGPAAAALAARCAQNWDVNQALDWLNKAGTSPDYKGLFETVERFEPPTADELDRADITLTERVKVPDFVEGMIQIDERWEHLKAIRDAGFRTPPDQPDLDPPHEALMFVEHYRELQRLDEARQRGPDFVEQLRSAETHARRLSRSLARAQDQPPPDPAELNAIFNMVGRDCTSCHKVYRN